MNAIVGLCHFCEAHGPRPLFCTFSTDHEEHTTESSKSDVQCSGCTSLGPETVYVSRDEDDTIYCSRETVPNPDVTSFLRQAAIRSITCEVTWSNEGGVVYFNDTHGHVLGLTFQLKDTWARGLKRWFSIVVLMKDKLLLFSLTPFLSEHMQKISKELQELAEVVFDAEQKVCSQRALRLKTGRNDFVQSRSLMHLTGDDNVFKRLHSHFTWMLKAGAKTYSEKIYTSQDLLKKLLPQDIQNSIFEPGACSVSDDKECVSLRMLKKLLSPAVFRVLMYCTLTGIDIVIKTCYVEAATIIKGLSRLLPINIKDNPRLRQLGELFPPDYVCLLVETAKSNFRIDWAGTLPDKDPTLMNRIESSMNNNNFSDEVLHQHIKSMQLEWLGIAKAVKYALNSPGSKSDSAKKLMQVFGVANHDMILLNYWMTIFCN